MPREHVPCFLLTAALVCISAIIHPAQSVACELPCSEPVRLFAPDGAAPGNLIRFKLLSPDPGPLQLKTREGRVIAASIRTLGEERVFAPDAPVPAGMELVLHYRSACQTGGSGRFPFRTLAPADVQTRPAELEVSARGVLYPDDPRNEAAFVDIQHYAPDATGAAWHLIDTVATVDGMPVELALEGGPPRIRVQSYCSDHASTVLDTCGNLRAVAPGKHVVSVASTIVGESTQPPPVTMEVTLGCDATQTGSAKGMSPERTVSAAQAPRVHEPPRRGGGLCALLPAQRSGPCAAMVWAITAFVVFGVRRYSRHQHRSHGRGGGTTPFGQICWPAGTAKVGVESSMVLRNAIKSRTSVAVGTKT